jgi:DNA-binding NarL/FixJ family response regulator
VESDRTGSLFASDGRVTLADLTPRQRQVAELIAMGLTRRTVAHRLSEGSGRLSIRTVDAHLRAVADRLPRNELPASRRVRAWVLSQRESRRT